MKTNMKIMLTVLALGVSALTATAQDQAGPPPSGDRPPGNEAAAGGPGGRGGFHLLPPRAQEQLNLTADQMKQLASLESETKAKLEKILTPEQMQKLQDMRPPMRPGGMRGPGPGNRPVGQGRGPGGNPGADDNNMPPGPPPGDN
jgi:Spy/CpxP family protein refolding chaperone